MKNTFCPSCVLYFIENFGGNSLCDEPYVLHNLTKDAVLYHLCEKHINRNLDVDLKEAINKTKQYITKN